MACRQGGFVAQKTPKMLLSDWCRQNKRLKPRFRVTADPAAPGSFTAKARPLAVVILDLSGCSFRARSCHVLCCEKTCALWERVTRRCHACGSMPGSRDKRSKAPRRGARPPVCFAGIYVDIVRFWVGLTLSAHVKGTNLVIQAAHMLYMLLQALVVTRGNYGYPP